MCFLPHCAGGSAKSLTERQLSRDGGRKEEVRDVKDYTIRISVTAGSC
jgi:hypothetical protein